MKSKTKCSKVTFALVVSMFAMASPFPAVAKQKTELNQPTDEELYSSVGDTLVKVVIKEPLPNALGGSDIFGRKREKGFVEIRFMGMNKDGHAVFHRRSVDVVSNETTMSRSQSLFPNSTINQSGSGANAAVIVEGDDGAGMEVLPPNTVEFALDVSKYSTITVEDYLIQIHGVDPGGVSFTITQRKRKR